MSLDSRTIFTVFRTLPDTMGTRESSLHVFKRGAVEHRLVATKRDTSNPGYHQESGMQIIHPTEPRN